MKLLISTTKIFIKIQDLCAYLIVDHACNKIDLKDPTVMLSHFVKAIDATTTLTYFPKGIGVIMASDMYFCKLPI